MAETRKVLVTTSHRGVFFGELDAQQEDTVVLLNCRNAIYWGTTKGFLELAATGPTPRSRVGSRAPRVELRSVTSITDCTPEAAAKWEAA